METVPLPGTEDAPEDAPVPDERGRYAIFEETDGTLVIGRSAPLCEACAKCGCGEQREPLRVPGPLVRMARAAAAGEVSVMSALRKAARSGG